MNEWLNFVVDILSVPAILVGLAAFVGYIVQKDKNFSDALAGGLKAAIGFFILVAGAVTLIGPLDVLGPMLEAAFGITGVIPNNEAIVSIALVGELAQATSLIMILGFVFNIIFALITPFKYIWLTGHHSLFMAALGPVAITFLLVRVSGVRMLEKGLLDRKPDYADYVQRTNAFVPWKPRRQATDSSMRPSPAAPKGRATARSASWWAATAPTWNARDRCSMPWAAK